MKTLWFIALVSTICLEGLGRKYLPEIPSGVFYFAKDAVLVLGYLWLRPPTVVSRVGRRLYGGFRVVWAIALIWTVMEFLNPGLPSKTLGLIGLRAYWLWWMAPLVIATALQNEKQKNRAIYLLLIMAVGISILAAFQFAAPPDSSLNLYSVVDGEEQYADQSVVSATGRARVAATFSYISGFTAFTTLVPTLLLSLGLDARNRNLRRAAFIGTLVTAAVVPMSGSRASVMIGVIILVITAWTAGLFITRVGRRVMVGGIAAAILAVAVFPDAFLGVESRFENVDETTERYALTVASVVPPIAMATFDYPAFGIGTGMSQNVRLSMKIPTQWEAEVEAHRFLVELGPVGYILVWGTKVGLVVALLRAYRILKRAGRRGASSAAMSYAALTLLGSPTFDHVWQALYFMGCGFILAEVVSVTRAAAVEPAPAPAAEAEVVVQPSGAALPA